MSRFFSFVARLFGRRGSSAPTPPAGATTGGGVPPVVVVSPVVVPPVVVPPVVVPPVVVPPVVVPPSRARLHRLDIFCESFDGTRCDGQLAKLDWPKDQVWIHTWDPAAKWSAKGRRVLCIKNPNGGGSNEWDNPIKDWRPAIDRLCRRAKAAGCSATSIDLENWLIAAGPELIKHMYGASHAVGLPLINVPKVGLEHLLVERDNNYAWTSHRPGRAGLTPQEVVDILSVYTDVDVQWYYSTRWQTFVEARNELDKLNYRTPIVPMIDGAGRDGVQRNADAPMAAMVAPLWKEFGSLAIFNPHNLGPKLVAELRKVRNAP